MIEQMIAYAQDQFTNNDMLVGIIGGGVFASLAYMGRALPNRIMRTLDRQLTVKTTIYNTDYVFDWFKDWMKDSGKFKNARMLSMTGDRGSDDKIKLTPGEGTHFFWYERQLIILDYMVQTESVLNREPLESFTITTFGRNNRLINAIRKRVKEYSDKRDYEYLPVRIGNFTIRKAIRDSDTVYSPHMQAMIEDAQEFNASKEWYRRRGVPYRRGYLFFGTPGCGKTSAIAALASALKTSIAYISLKGISDDRLIDLVLSGPEGELIVFEDVDCVNASKDRDPKKDKKSDDESKDEVTLTGLLNVIDGLLSGEGDIFILTSNYPDDLDEALTRPGRIDKKWEFAPLTSADAVRMWNTFYCDEVNLDPMDDMPEGLLPAKLQCILLEHKTDPAKAREVILGEDK